MSKVIFNLLPSKTRGGMEQVFLDYSEILKANGERVIAIVPQEFQYFAELEKLGVEYERLNISGHYDLYASLRFLFLLRKYKAQTILSHNGRGFAIVNFLRRFLAKNIKDIAVCHGGSLKRVVPFANAIIVSQYIADDLQKLGFKGRIFHIPNFLKLTNDSKELTAKKNDKIFRFGAMSRLVKSKNFAFMLCAYAMFEHQNSELIIAGEGEEKSALEKLAKELKIADRVKFVGWVDDKKEFYNNIDCFIHPAFAEPFGLIILDAMSFAVAVIAASNCGPQEIITDGENGFLFAPEKIYDLQQKMNLVFEKSELRRSAAYSGYELVKEKYNFASGQTRLLQVMKEINDK